MLRYYFSVLCVGLVLLCSSCIDDQLEHVKIDDNPFIKASTKPKVLIGQLDNPSAPLQVDGRIIFSEGGKGTILEYKNKEVTTLIEGFGIDNYAGYSISVLGITTVPGENKWIVAASEDVGHIYMYDILDFPTTKDNGIEIPFERLEAANPYDVLLVDNGKRLVATGGTKATYQGDFESSNPSTLKPVFEVETGIAGIAEDVQTGMVYGAIIGSGMTNDGFIVRWNPTSEVVQLDTISAGFSNLVDVLVLPNGLLMALEFGEFGKPSSGRLSIVDPQEASKHYPFINGLDAPSGISLSTENDLLITTYGKTREDQDGMLIKVGIELNSKD